MAIYHITNRNDFSRVHDTSFLIETGKNCHFPVFPFSNFLPRKSALYLEIQETVTNPQLERQLREVEQGTTRIGSSYILGLDNSIILPESFLVFCGDAILADSFRALGALTGAGFKPVSERSFEYSDLAPEITDDTAILLGIQTNYNFFHWLFEALPRLSLCRSMGLLTPSNVVVAPPLRQWMRDALVTFGFGDITLVELKHCMQPRRLIIPARGLSNIRTFSRHCIDMFAELRTQRELGNRRRLYVSRSLCSSRKIVNEPEVIEELKSHGFETIWPERLSIREQIRLFNSAECAAGALGAGLGSCAFMHPGSALLEFAPEGRTGDATLFANMAEAFELKFACLVGMTVHSDKPIDRRDFYVPIEKVQHALDVLGI